MAHIRTYCRMRPTTTFSQCFDWDSTKVYVRIPEVTPSGRISVDKGKTVDHEFGFGALFGPHSSQDEVFDTVAKDIVSGFLSGYNGTIFAYGQTGSGKTFTVEGGARRYSDRGLAPRALSMIYRALESRQDEDISVHVSYLEIYQEIGYDLLNPSTRPGNVVTHLPKVHVVEGPQNTCIVRNLSQHLAADEHIAQTLLLQGQGNRKVAETPMNQRSSRSHAVFTIHLTARSPGSEVITRSKLHLVDLAGSERASKTGISGQQLGEAKFINLSLHHLESVIIALQDDVRITEARSRSNSFGSRSTVRIGSASSTRSNRSRSSSFHGSTSRYIPYRNSLLTMVLRDSLGGNCLTVMIATISIEESNLGESVSTCRFAQRVACIKNHASRNEELDDKMVIKRLRKRIRELEAEIACLKSMNCEGDKSFEASLDAKLDDDEAGKIPRSVSLSDDDKKLCVKIMHGFIGGRVKDPVSAGVTDPYKFRECMHILREMLMRSYAVEEKRKQSAENFESTPPQRVERHHRERRHHSGSYDDSVNAKDADKPVEDETVPGVHKRIWSAPPSENRRSHRERERDHKRAVEEAHQVLSPRNAGSGHNRSRNNYKTPFEEKREKDIKRIGAKVDRFLNTQAGDEKELMDFQITVREEKLEFMETELINKIEALNESIAQQHAYIVQLKRAREDTETIVNEKKVLNQLRNRQGKYERRLQFVKEQLVLFEHHQKMLMADETNNGPNKENDDSPGKGETASYKEKLMEKYQYRDGRMDSRKVLEILKKEEKKQEKLQNKIDQQRIQAVSDHMSIKEAQTRQKLAEFQDKLKQAKEERQKHGQSRPSTANSSWSSPGTSWWNTSSKEDSDMSGNSGIANSSLLSKSGDVTSPAVNGWMNSTPKSSSGSTHHNWSGLSPSEDTPSNVGLSRDKSLGDKSDHKSSSASNSGISMTTVSKQGIGPTISNHSTSVGNDESVTVEDIEEGHPENNVISKTSVQRNLFTSKETPDKPGNSAKTSFDDSFLYKPARNPMMMMSKKQKQKKENVPNENGEFAETHSPVEYSQNEEKYPFNPQKFSLQSKTFDSAMTTMLDDRTSVTTAQSKDPSDWFSSSKWSNYSSGYGDSASQSGVSSPSYGRPRSSPVPNRLQWSVDKTAESNPLTMKEKLSRYLDKASSPAVSKRMHPMMPRRSTATMDFSVGDDISTFASSSLKLASPSMESLATDPISMYMTSSFYTQDGRTTPDSDVGAKMDTKANSSDNKVEGSVEVTTEKEPAVKKSSRPKIKAMDESEREQSYVNAVKQQKERVAKIRRAVRAAEVIQNAWRKYQSKNKR